MITYGFFNAVNTDGVYDREYTADQLSEYLEGIVGNGVFANPSTSLQILASETPDMNVTIKAGKGWIDGYWLKNDADFSIAITQAAATLDRIDRVVMRLDLTERTMNVVIKEGTPSSNPVVPELTRTELIKEYSLAIVKINAKQTMISQASITDTRADNAVCGWVTSLVDQVDTTTLYNQYEAAQSEFITKKQVEFETWFNDLQETLATATILRQYNNSVITEEEKDVYEIGITQFNSSIDTLNVYKNGVRLVPDTDYTFDNYTVTLKSMPLANQSLDFQVFRNVNGEDVATIIDEFEEVQTQMSKLMKYNYFATGVDDNIAINTIVQNFYDGVEQFAGVDESASLELKIYGKLGISEVDHNGYKALFVADKTNAESKRCTLDFSGASKIEYSSEIALTGVAMTNITIKGLNMSIVSSASAVGLNGRYVLEYCVINVNGLAAHGLFGSGNLLNCTIETTSENGVSYAINIQDEVTKVDGGNLGAYRKTGGTSNAAAVHMNAEDAYYLSNNVYLHKWEKTGYETLYALNLQAGRYAVLGGIRAVINSISSSALGTITGEIDLAGTELEIL